MARFAVIGAGIAGLSAAWELERAAHDVVVFEAAREIGGKLQRSRVRGLAFPIEAGADAFLARVPDALELCAEIGIDELVHPATSQAWIWSDDRLHPLPKAQLLGLPTDLDELAAGGLLSPEGLARAAEDLDSDAPPLIDDVSVGALVRSRLGDEVCDHLVEPLLGGINGGEADGLSTQACAPQLWACAARGGSLIRAAAEVKARTAPSDAPVFAAPAEGMAALPRRLADRLRAEIRFGTVTPPLTRRDGQIHVGDGDFAGVVVATPADVAGPLVARVAHESAAALEATEFASVVMVTVVARASAVDHALDGSGVVVARDAGLSITACSFGSSKWAHWDDGRNVVFRLSLGHDGDPVDWCTHSDEDLRDVALADLERLLGVPVPPVGVRVGRWARSFPQYRPGHVDRVADIRAEVAGAGPIALAGMSYDGIGVPACIRSGRTAARQLLA